jgi:hypothetical protein
MNDPLLRSSEDDLSFLLKAITDVATTETVKEKIGLKIAQMIEKYIRNDKRLPGKWDRELKKDIEQIESLQGSILHIPPKEFQIIASLIPEMKMTFVSIGNKTDYMPYLLDFIRLAKKLVIEFIPCVDTVDANDIISDLKMIALHSHKLLIQWVSPRGSTIIPVHDPLLTTSSSKLRAINEALWNIRWNDPSWVAIESPNKRSAKSSSDSVTLDSKGLELEHWLVNIHKLGLQNKMAQFDAIHQLVIRLQEFTSLLNKWS